MHCVASVLLELAGMAGMLSVRHGKESSEMGLACADSRVDLTRDRC